MAWRRWLAHVRAAEATRTGPQQRRDAADRRGRDDEVTTAAASRCEATVADAMAAQCGMGQAAATATPRSGASVNRAMARPETATAGHAQQFARAPTNPTH